MQCLTTTPARSRKVIKGGSMKGIKKCENKKSRGEWSDQQSSSNQVSE